MATKKTKVYRVTNGRGIAKGIPIFQTADKAYLKGAIVRSSELKPSQIEWLIAQRLLVEVKDAG